MTMPAPHGGGWGNQSWGGSGWGGPLSASSGSGITATGAFAPAENVVRILLTGLPYFSGIFDAYDASDPTHYGIVALASTGWDGNPARAVSVVQALISTAQSNALDVYLDRPMSPYPSQYAITATNLAASGGSPILLSTGALQYYGLYRRLQPQHEDVALPSRDIASPQTASAIQGSGLGSALGPGATLGVYQFDDSGDYAFDAGLQSLKKRILRRGVTDKGAFAHLPRNYGVGLLSACKRLGGQNVANKYAADYQAQILQEPEVRSASVVAVLDPSYPGLVHFVINVQTRSGTSLSFDHPLDTITGVSLAQV